MSRKQTQTNKSTDTQTNWIEIARTGTFTDSSGKTVTLTETDLDELAAIDESQRRVPLVLGHPKTDSPAWGWVDQAKRVGAALLASFKDVHPMIQGAVQDKLYQNVSIRRGPDRRLWHVGLLGAVQPAIPGMAPVTELAEDEGETLIFSAPGPGDGDQAQAETETDPKEEPMDEKDQDQSTMEQLAKMQADMDKLKEDVKASELRAQKAESDLAAAQEKIVRETREAKVNKLIAEGKMLPSEKDDALQLAGAFDIAREVTLSAENSEKLVRAEDLFWKQYEDRQPNGLLQELSAPENETDQTPALNLAAKL